MPLQREDVRAGVLNALYWDLAVPRHGLNVDVKNGWVTVSGMVDLPYQRSCAEFDAKSVAGVVGVINLIRLAQRAITKPLSQAAGSNDGGSNGLQHSPVHVIG
jgi:osmotically-inducible protein OsmY